MKAILLINLLLGVSFFGSLFRLDKTQSSMSIAGTSSVHDWESVVNDFSVTANINGESITDLKVEVEVKSIKSNKSIMDNKTYDALEAGKYPTIFFSAAELKTNGGLIEGVGTLKLVGKSASIPITAKILTQSTSELKVRGEVQIVMSEYGISPPTAMFGTLKTGDEVTIKYELVLKK